jgi:hypothetical protein
MFRHFNAETGAGKGVSGFEWSECGTEIPKLGL